MEEESEFDIWEYYRDWFSTDWDSTTGLTFLDYINKKKEETNGN